MLTKLTIRNFKRFGETQVEIELGNPVVFIGPNNSGKTSAMQALALWDIGLKRWNEKRSGMSAPEKRPGVTVNRRDLVAIPKHKPPMARFATLCAKSTEISAKSASTHRRGRDQRSKLDLRTGVLCERGGLSIVGRFDYPKENAG